MVLCAGAFGCYAAQGSLPGAQGQGYDLNLSYSRTTLKAVADAITQQVGIAFSYETALAGYPMENLEVSEKGATIEAILAAVFTPRGIDYRVVDKVVVLTRSTRPVPAASAAAKSEVKGVVRDAAGNPMIGVTVTIKGTLVGVSTGVDGGYAIPADGNATLLFSYIGYRPHEEVVGRRTQIDVTMQEDELVMDEVVVVGYGTLKKRNIVGAVENLSGDAVENRPNANITRSLQGQIPGLNIVQVDGKADHAGEVTIRGVNNTFKARVSGGEKTNKLGQGGGALVLIDGAEGDMGSVNPDDIASISVLKDASSAAVYGARGAFGVILITTKDPEKGKVRVSYNGSVSLHRRTVIWEDNVVTDPVQWVDAFRESYLNSSPTATVPSLFNNYMPYSNAWFEELKRRRADPTMDNYDIDANGNYNYYGETNWLKEIYKSVNYSTTHAVSIQGGREGVSYYISGRYYNQDGIYKVGEETYKKYNLRAKGSIRIRPWLTLDNNTSLMSSKYHQPMVHYGQQVISRQIDMFAFPFALLKNPDGTWTQTAAKTGYAAFAEGTSWQENNKLEVANTTTFNFEFVPDVFKVSADVTYKGSRWSRDRMENLYTYYTGVNVSGQDNSYSSLENWTYRSDYISTNIVGTVTPKLGADHDLNVVAGWNLEDYDYRTQKTYRQGNLYPSKPSFTLMDGEYYSTTSGGYTWGLVGFFGRVNYAYAGRYLAEVSARYDGSSKFPSSSQWGFFPSASVGWRLSEEPWLKPHVEGWLDNFKVRASIGSLGNANIDPYQYLETMTASGSASIAKSSVIINGQNVPYTSVPSLIPDVEATVDGYKAKGTPVYGITLGDIVFDTPDLWSNMKESMANRNLPIFQTIGNHDHLQTETSDDNAAANFETQFGPRNYSFNRGDVHIVSMDNVLYEGKKKYKGGITDKQLEWLRQDLSHVDKDKLVIFCAHIPFRGGTSVTDESHENYDGVLDLLSGFSEAHIMIGHTHYHQKYIHKRNGKTILEHVHGAACGAWWTANICADGTPNGYSVYEISGNTIANQYYKSTNKEAGYQIRAYSATQVFGKSGSLTFGWAANAPAMNDAKCIVANVWNSDASGNWKVSLWQNGTKVCDMTRVKTYDYWAYAYHVLYYSKSVGTTWGKNLDHYYYGNLASGTPETADFEIVAEDGMGNTYRTSKLQTDFIGF